jgi:hypothetical protein
MPRITVALDAGTRKQRYGHVDLCNHCYPPPAEELARMSGVGVADARAAIKCADFGGAAHGPYEQADHTCDAEDN